MVRLKLFGICVKVPVKRTPQQIAYEKGYRDAEKGIYQNIYKGSVLENHYEDGYMIKLSSNIDQEMEEIPNDT